MPDLFEYQAEKELKKGAPLAARMRPRNFDEFVGQEHVVGPGRVLRKAIESDQVPSMVLWGPPGSGKTTLAQIIANSTKSHFSHVSAVSAGVADLRRIVEEARERRGQHSLRTILFVDEIHRFNKAQQDAILPHVENGTVTFVGATTENPSFEVISPLLSRCRVFVLHQLGEEQIDLIVDRAIEDQERGLGKLDVQVEPDAKKFLIEMANGDARTALNALELAVNATARNAAGKKVITLATVEDALQHRSLMYDRAGEQHYDVISAFIKSLRGSDPDAAVYWLARMVETGEDPLFIARRMVILAAEDIGLADPQALVVAIAAQQAVHFVGMPEGYLPLSEAALYLATAPKSNSALTAYSEAMKDVKQTLNEPVPLHLRNAVTGLMGKLGYGRGYRYAHSYEEHQVAQQHLPSKLAGRRYYHPGDQGFEKELGERMKRWGKRPGQSGPPQEEKQS